MVDLNSGATSTPPDAAIDASSEIKEESPVAEAIDIDTDELESLLTDLKATKKRNKMPAKKRERKPKTLEPVVVEDIPVVVEEAPIVEEPEVKVEVPAVEAKPKRKYVRKPQKPAAIVDEPQTPHASPVPEPTKRTNGAIIEEMQRAERALRYQMRKNKMQTLVSQAF